MPKITLADYGNLQNETTVVAQLNANNTLIENALENTISRDGSIPNQMNNELDMNSNRIINLPDATSNQEPVTLGVFNAISTGSGNVPSAGATNQILSKNSDTSYDTHWVDVSSEVLGGSNIAITGTSPVTIHTVTNPVLSGVSGGAATNSSLTLQSTNNAAPSGDVTNLYGSTVNVGNRVNATTTINLTGTSGGGNVVNIGSAGNGVSSFNLYNNAGSKQTLVGGGSNTTLTFPTVTDTLVSKTSTDVLTNKTFNTAGTGNVLQINGTGITAVSGTGSVILSSSAAISQPATDTINFNGSTSGTTKLTGPAIGTTKIVTLPDITDTIVTKNSVDTLTNKLYNTASSGNAFYINSNQITSNTGTGAVNVLQTSPTLTTPILGAATATTINGSTVSPGHYSGEPSTGSAVAGEIGEYVASTVLSGSAVALTSTVTSNITSISLTAGDWDVSALACVIPTASTTVGTVRTSISNTSAVVDNTVGRDYQNYWYNSAVGPFIFPNNAHPPYRLSLSSTTTIYLVVNATFGTSTLGGYGQLRARRMR